MVGFLFAVLCWLTWYLSPHNLSLLVFNKEAIEAGQWWRLWTAHLTHFSFSELILNSSMIALVGLMLGRFVKSWSLVLSLLIAMPMMTGLLLLLRPDLIHYRGAFVVADMMLMMAAWFLILENKTFSLGYWIGLIMLLLFVAALGLEIWMMIFPARGHSSGSHVVWLVQCIGVLLGLAFFNALHQSYSTRIGKHAHYRGASNKPRQVVS